MPKARKTFKRDVEAALGNGTYRSGLQALAPVDRTRISVSDTRSLGGSADIDAALKSSQPNAHRWDYLLDYGESASIELYWIEVHPARTTDDLREVLNKLAWLRKWLSGKPLDGYQPRQFIWISSGKTVFNQRSPQSKQLARQGCMLVGHLTI